MLKPDEIYVIKVETPPNEKGFVNGFVEWFESDHGGVVNLTREPIVAKRYNNRDAQLTAAWIMEDMPDRVVTIQIVD